MELVTCADAKGHLRGVRPGTHCSIALLVDSIKTQIIVNRCFMNCARAPVDTQGDIVTALIAKRLIWKIKSVVITDL